MHDRPVRGTDGCLAPTCSVATPCHHVSPTLPHTCTPQGTIVLDEVQYDYLLKLCFPPTLAPHFFTHVLHRAPSSWTRHSTITC